MAENFANDPQTTLAAAVTTTGQTAWTVASSTGFPATPFRAKIGTEIIVVTNVAGAAWTVSRNQESTTASTYSIGTTIYHVATAASLTNFAQKDQAATWTATQTFAGITATSASISGQAVVVTNDTRLAVQAAGTASIRALGTGATDAAAGNDSRFLQVCPPGTIALWGTATPPTGWLILNGQSTTGYSNLVTMFGANVPDMRGLFPVGVGTPTVLDTVLEAGGSATITGGNLPTHAHSMNSHTHTYGTSGPSTNSTSSAGADHTHGMYINDTGTNHTHGTGGVNQGHEHAVQYPGSNAVFYAGGGTGMDNAYWGASGGQNYDHSHGTYGVSSWHSHGGGTYGATAYNHTHDLQSHTHSGTSAGPNTANTATDGGSGTAYYPPFPRTELHR